MPFAPLAAAASGSIFLLLITPAWGQGLLGCAVFAALLFFAVLHLPVQPERMKQLMFETEYLALAVVVNSAFGVNFYNSWIDSTAVGRVAGLMHTTPRILVCFCAAALVILAAPAVSGVLHYYISAAVDAYSRIPAGEKKAHRIGMGWSFVLLFVLHLLALCSLLRANFMYMDDLGRTAFGYKQWDYFSRYLSTALASYIHMGNYLADAAPLPQLIAMAFLCTSDILLLYVLYERKGFSLWELILVLPLGLNPYFLECISYRYDAPYMALSILCAVLPLLFRRRHPAAYMFACMLSILSICVGYQGATGVFPMLVVLLCAKLWNEGEQVGTILRFLVQSVCGYLAGLIFFKLVIMIPADAGYVSNTILGIRELIPGFLNNLGRYYSCVAADFKKLWLLLLGILLVGVVVDFVLHTRRKKWMAAAAALIALSFMAMLCFGIYPALANTVFFPRTMYGFGVFIAILGCVCAQDGDTIKLPSKLAGLALSWAFVVFSLLYGNALYAQKTYTDFRIQMVIQDLNDLEAFTGDTPVTVQISGLIGQAPILQNMPRDGAILDRLVPETFGSAGDWANYGFYYYYNLHNVQWDQEADLTQMELPVLVDSMYHRIMGDNTHVLVVLK